MTRKRNGPLKGVKVLAPNVTSVEHGSNQILYSYNTPVAILAPSGLYKTATKWSKTTSRHINRWFQVHGLDAKGALELPQDVLESYATSGVDPISQRGAKKNAPKRPRRTKRRVRLIKEMGFFRSHGGGVVGEAAKGALDLARAEKYARDHDWEYEYHPEQDRYEDVYGDKDPGGEWVTVVLKNKKGDVLASLGFVDANDTKYLRVVRAELAYEAMPRGAGRSKNPRKVRRVVRKTRRVRRVVLRKKNARRTVRRLTGARRSNPLLGVLANPPADSKYLGKVTRIEYTHGHDGQPYYHDFKPPVYAQVMDDGRVVLWHPTNNLWKLFDIK